MAINMNRIQPLLLRSSQYGWDAQAGSGNFIITFGSISCKMRMCEEVAQGSHFI